MSDSIIERREAIKRVALLLGGASFVGGSALLQACEGERRVVQEGQPISAFEPDDVALLDEVADTMLPATKTPGAKAAKTGAFMALMVTDCYNARDQKIFRDGMASLDEASRKANGGSFVRATPAQRLAVLEQLDREQKTYMDAKKDDAPSHWFRMMKELALLGYFTSEIGYTQAQRYVEAPGRYDPCVPYKPGERAWAPHAR